MLFNSVNFLIFFPIVFILYWFARRHLKQQNTLLLIASYIFYGCWDIRFLFLLAFSTVVDFSCALKIDRKNLSIKTKVQSISFLLFSATVFLLVHFSTNFKKPSINLQYFPIISAAIIYIAIFYVLDVLSHRWTEERRRKIFLVFGIATNLLILGTFKYFNFFVDTLILLIHNLFGVDIQAPALKIILPVGLSFYTFQSISYTVDVYRKELKATDNFLIYAAYLSFFPQLVAGPIERGKHLLPQFCKIRPILSKNDIQAGLWLIVWGLYKKIVVADNMAKIVNATFAPFDQGHFMLPHDGFRLLVAIYAFALQIYGDFSGYTDIARGVAKLLGFDLILNFNLPYFARTPSDFWHKWHISLSSWLRDYLYIPLGGNRGGDLLLYRNLMLTMILGGLWHGASWTFVIWGAFHGIILCIYRFLNINENHKFSSWGPAFLQGIFMFHLTCIGWLLFRARNIKTVIVFLQSIFMHFHVSNMAWQNFFLLLHYGWFLIVFQIIQKVKHNLTPLEKAHWFVKLNVYTFLVMSILSFGSARAQQFIYFAF